MIKFSRQRESIKNNLMGRTDHPTAETVYSDIRQEYPNISLGTVYRNLSLLADLGEIQKFQRKMVLTALMVIRNLITTSSVQTVIPSSI